MTTMNDKNEQLDVSDEEMSRVLTEASVDIDKAIAEDDVDTLTEFIMNKIYYMNDKDNGQESRDFSSLMLMSVLERCEKAGDVLPAPLQREGWAAILKVNTDGANDCRKGINALEDCGFTAEEYLGITQYFMKKAMRKLVLIN